MGLFSFSKLKSSRQRLIRNRDFVNKYKKDKKCKICGYNKFTEILEFHHINSREKDKTINYLMKSLRSLETINEEIKKCVLLCSNCHRELHLMERYQNEK